MGVAIVVATAEAGAAQLGATLLAAIANPTPEAVAVSMSNTSFVSILESDSQSGRRKDNPERVSRPLVGFTQVASHLFSRLGGGARYVYLWLGGTLDPRSYSRLRPCSCPLGPSCSCPI